MHLPRLTLCIVLLTVGLAAAKPAPKFDWGNIDLGDDFGEEPAEPAVNKVVKKPAKVTKIAAEHKDYDPSALLQKLGIKTDDGEFGDGDWKLESVKRHKSKQDKSGQKEEPAEPEPQKPKHKKRGKKVVSPKRKSVPIYKKSYKPIYKTIYNYKRINAITKNDLKQYRRVRKQIQQQVQDLTSTAEKLMQGLRSLKKKASKLDSFQSFLSKLQKRKLYQRVKTVKKVARKQHVKKDDDGFSNVDFDKLLGKEIPSKEEKVVKKPPTKSAKDKATDTDNFPKFNDVPVDKPVDDKVKADKNAGIDDIPYDLDKGHEPKAKKDKIPSTKDTSSSAKEALGKDEGFENLPFEDDAASAKVKAPIVKVKTPDASVKEPSAKSKKSDDFDDLQDIDKIPDDLGEPASLPAKSSNSKVSSKKSPATVKTSKTQSSKKEASETGNIDWDNAFSDF